MPSFDSINYSLRPSKSVQRALVFKEIKRVFEQCDMANAVYVGLGSIWFTDFVMAHKILGIDDMVSIEKNEVGFRRASYNKVYRTIDVRHGESSEILPQLLEEPGFSTRPWVLWLDYDGALDEDKVAEMQWAVSHLPTNSIVLFTFSATQAAYGQRIAQRPSRLKTLLGEVVPDDLTREQCEKGMIHTTLADLTLNFIKSEVADSARPGGFIDAFKMTYLDTVEMVTVGGILPTKGAAPVIRTITDGDQWIGRVADMIAAPQMTLREVSALQAELPCGAEITRARVQEIGFDLEEEQIRSFQRYYKYLPSFAEIVA
jgi:hypothetical protein